MKGNHCKHILFIYLKVLQVSQSSAHWYQKALLTSELEEVFAAAPLAPNAEAHPRIKQALDKALGKTSSTTEAAAATSKKKMPEPDDDCPICYESMCKAGKPVDESKLTWCEECSNAVHMECFKMWRTTSMSTGKPLTCVYCRARWVDPSVASGSGVAPMSGEGYINLSGVAGVSPVRDSSSYYNGPRRGQRYYGGYS